MLCFYLFMYCTNALQDLIDSQGVMLPWLTIYNNNQYSRWLTIFWSVFTNLPRDQEGSKQMKYLKECIFTKTKSLFDSEPKKKV